MSRPQYTERVSLNEWDIQIVKSADESVTNSAALQNDDELKWNIKANEVWRYQFIIFYTTDTTGDFKMDLALSAGTAIFTYRWQGQSTTNTNTASGDHEASVSTTTDRAFGGSGANTVLRNLVFEGNLSTSSADATVTFRFAQNTATSGQSATVKKGSMLFAKRLA